MATIRNNLTSKLLDTKAEGAFLAVGTEIFDNHDLMAAHFVMFGNKINIARKFGYKTKDVKESTTKALDDTISKRLGEVKETHVIVDAQMSKSCKRVRRLPAGSPSGAADEKAKADDDE